MPSVIACSTLPFTHRPLGEVLAQLDGAGFSHWELPIRGDGVHLGHVDPAPLLEDANHRAQVLQACRGPHRPRLISAGFEIDRRSPLPRELAQFRACAELVAELGGRIISVFAFDDGAVPCEVRLQALATTAREAGLELVVETHRRTATQDPARAFELATSGHALNLDHSHYASQGLAPAVMATLRPHAKLVQVRGCTRGQVEAPIATEAQQRDARNWWDWLKAGVAADVPVVIDHIDREQDWWPSLKFWRELIAG